MADNKGLVGSPDNKRIDVNDPNEVRNWTKAIRCTEAELKNAVRAVGTSAAAVRRHLGK